MTLCSLIACLPAWVWGKEAEPEPERFRLKFRRAGGTEDAGRGFRREEAGGFVDDDGNPITEWMGFKIPHPLTADEVAEGNKARDEAWVRRAGGEMRTVS